MVSHCGYLSHMENMPESLDAMLPITREALVEHILNVLPEGTVLEYDSGVRRMVVAVDHRTGDITTQTLPYPDGTMPKGQRILTTSFRRILRRYGI